jgi:hypothetical protein
MEYRFTMTARLVALTLISFVLLLGLLFALGFQIGERWARDETRLKTQAVIGSVAPVSSVITPPTVPALPAPVIPAISVPPLPMPGKN